MRSHLNKMLNWNEKRGMYPLFAILFAAFFVAAGIASAAHAGANPFRAPNPGDFVSGSLQCSTHVGHDQKDNYIRMTGKMQNRRPSLFYVGLVDNNLVPTYIVSNNGDISFTLNGEKDNAGDMLVVSAWDGNPRHANKIEITVSGVAPSQYYTVVGEYLDENPDGQNSQNFLITAKASDKDCVLMD